MAFDGICVSAVVRELNTALAGGRIDKIYQPEKDEIILSIRNHGENHRLLMSANASHPRLHLTGRVKDNPQSPPLFCMVMRKHLSGGRVVSVEQPGLERVALIGIESRDEMGDLCVKTLVIEIMGKHSNIMLASGGRIIDAVKHVSHAQSSVREVLPGREYIPAPGQNKLNPLELTREGFMSAAGANPGLLPQGLVYRSYTGISPLSASEVVERAGVDPSKKVSELDEVELDRLYTHFSALMEDVRSGVFAPEVAFDGTGRPSEFSCFPLSMLNGEKKRLFDSPSAMLDFYYAEKDSRLRAGQKSQDLRQLVRANIERCVKKRDVQQRALDESAGRELLRLHGELLTANIYAVEVGAKSFTARNFYDEDMPEVIIPLDPAKTPAQNAQALFRKYAKQKRTAEAMAEQLAQNAEELEYLEGVLNALETSIDEADIADVRRELAEEGFIKRRRLAAGGKPKPSKPMRFRSSDGFEIFVGKNNKQNDELTLHFAMPDDIWLHTKNIPGSHVIIRTEGGNASDAAITEAAHMAAFYSRARIGSLVPVDYTQRRYVKKPSGAKPGFVIYETNKTAYVTPDEATVNALRQD